MLLNKPSVLSVVSLKGGTVNQTGATTGELRSPERIIVKPVLSKRDFVARYALGEFGNSSPTWNTFDALKQNCHSKDGLYHIRNRIAGAVTWYDVPYAELEQAWNQAVALYGRGNLYISEMCPTEKTTFQGEVRQSENHYDLTYTTIALPMRQALAVCTNYADGIMASLLLQHFMCPKSHDWLQILLDRYPGHVVEFTCFSIQWGTLPGFNTVIWEVRGY